jgi:hypothetical protein
MATCNEGLVIIVPAQACVCERALRRASDQVDAAVIGRRPCDWANHTRLAGSLCPGLVVSPRSFSRSASAWRSGSQAVDGATLVVERFLHLCARWKLCKEPKGCAVRPADTQARRGNGGVTTRGRGSAALARLCSPAAHWRFGAHHGSQRNLGSTRSRTHSPQRDLRAAQHPQLDAQIHRGSSQAARADRPPRCRR